MERHSRLRNETLYEKSGAKAPLCLAESKIALLKKRRLIPYLGNNLTLEDTALGSCSHFQAHLFVPVEAYLTERQKLVSLL